MLIFQCCDKILEIIDLKEEKFCFGLWFQSMLLCCFGEVEQGDKAWKSTRSVYLTVSGGKERRKGEKREEEEERDGKW